AKGDLDRVRQDVDAALKRATRILVELELLVSHLLLFLLRSWFLGGCACGLARADDLREDVRLTQDQHLVGAELDLGAAVLGEDHLVALGDVHRNALPVLVAASRARGEHASALWLLLRGVGKDDAADRHLLLLQHLDDQAVTQRLKIHTIASWLTFAAAL